ncbi:hypothetical protein EST38_g233 [Candolleomyces aberdarensis]|uniref:Pkinase-domain-containing protein n=1 Tax=Candolleomyces aberdarensis TaxID=2316362 RepID=A0A4Q2E1M4_9AGAR|nr:hypothetical protein EST38_g233 [Candolleomyces aberdarensis]
MYEEHSHMDYEGDSFSYSQDSEVSTQQTQSTQQLTQPVVPPTDRDSHLWGYLQPVNDKLSRIDFWREQRQYTIGRNTELNKIVFPGFKVSNRHCEITWSAEDTGGTVLVLDLSSNGTFINGQKVGRSQTRILREGNEIAFGTPAAQPHSPFEDYRFIYRHVAGGPPTTGLYAFYDIGTELGKGSFATVMKAVNRETGVWYAVKMIKDKTAGRGGDQQGQIRNAAIAREINIMEKLKHPNICELKEVFLEENGPDINLVIELVEGGDLLEYILKRGGLGEDDAKHITYQICDALSYIHSQGITHRDLKPENVLLTKDEPPVVKVADFGLAKIVDSVTMLRTMCGTPSYLAPEVVKQTDQQEGYDNLVDSWSVGVIVFSMLTNASPFIEDENQTNLRTRIIERHIDWATLQAQNISQDAFDFIVALLQEDPMNRMGLKEALDHPWLSSYLPLLPPSSRNRPLQASSSGARAGVTHNFIGLQIQSSPNSTAGGKFGQREGSRGAPLQRRADILSQAAEGNRAVPEPSPEMIANASAKEAKKGKRVRNNLTPLDEEEEGDPEGSRSGPATRSRDTSQSSGGPRSKKARTEA